MFKRSALVLLPVIAALVLVLTGCPGMFGGDGDGDGDLTAEELTDKGYQELRDGDWEGALDSFSQALQIDPTYGEAIAPYSLLTLATIPEDSAIRSIVANDLGIVGFPTGMSDVYSPDWLYEVTIYITPDEGLPYYETLQLPAVEGMADFRDLFDDDGDGEDPDIGGDPVGPVERLLAACRNAATNIDVNMNSRVSAAASAMASRLNTAAAALEQAPDDMMATFTWDMFTDDAFAPDWWPTDESENPVDAFYVGKPEAKAVMAFFRGIEALLHVVQAYDYSLPLAEYWTVYNPVDGTGGYPSTTPFAGNFLGFAADYATHMTAARAALLEAFGLAWESADAILKDRAGLSLSSTSGLFGTEGWDKVEYGLTMAQNVAEQMIASLEGDVYAVFPTTEGFDVMTQSWPTVGDIGTTASGVNLGLFFTSPVSLLADTVELNKGTPLPNPDEQSGEPVWYKLDAGAFSLVTLADLPASTGYDFSTSGDTYYYMKIPDVTMGGISHISAIPVDDPLTRYSDLDMGWDDLPDPVTEDPPNGRWDPGEPIYYAELWTDIEGPIDNDQVTGNYGATEDPYAWYFEPDHSVGTPAVPSEHVAPENWNSLWTALDGVVNIEGGRVGVMSRLMPDHSLYLGFTPNFVAWNSFVPADPPTNGFDWEGNPITSTGSVWWAGLDALTSMGDGGEEQPQ